MKTTSISEFANTADVLSGPDLESIQSELIVKYIDYKNNLNSYKFSDVISFKLVSSSLSEYNGIDDTDQCEVVDSEIISELRRKNIIGKNEIARHILIGFNERGGEFVDVIFCGKITILGSTLKCTMGELVKDQ